MTTITSAATRAITALVVSATLVALLAAMMLGAHLHSNQSETPNGTACVQVAQLLLHRSVVHTTVCIPDVPLER